MTRADDHTGLGAFTDPRTDYPANHFAIQYLLNALSSADRVRLVEVGTGHGSALGPLASAGLDVSGFDIDPSLVVAAREQMPGLGLDPDSVTVGDIEDPVSYATVLRDGPYDALLALGILPNVANESQALRNMWSLVRPGGEVFVEFRNSLFSLFTFNRYTRDFIVDDLLASVSGDIRSAVSDFLATRVDLERPPRPADGSGPPWRFHNPFEVTERFAALGFEDIRPHFFHYHPAMPALAVDAPAAFRRESLRLENDAGWRGIFLCSAFLVHARRPASPGASSAYTPWGILSA